MLELSKTAAAAPSRFPQLSHVTYVGETINAHKILTGERDGYKMFGRPRH
jgi:hypothetical protein